MTRLVSPVSPSPGPVAALYQPPTTHPSETAISAAWLRRAQATRERMALLARTGRTGVPDVVRCRFMDAMTAGADIATMATGLSVVTASAVWVRSQWRGYQARRAAIHRRNWHGYIEPGGINEWYVRLAEEPDLPDGRVVLDVVDAAGKPQPNRANNMRNAIMRDGQLARVPNPAEYDFLRYLRQKRAYTDGYPVTYGELPPDSWQP